MNEGLIYFVDTKNTCYAKEYLTKLSEEELFKEFKRKCKDGLVLCNKCKKPIFDKKNSKTGLRFMSHYKNNNLDIKCDNFDTSIINKYGARSNIYYGEGSIHEELNNFITSLLKNEARFQNVKSEEYIFSNTQKYHNGIRKRKKPDIQADYKDTKIAFEIQLSYQLHVDFFSREEFYKKDGMFLMWFFYNIEKEEFKESDKMIFWNSNENAYVITEETKEISGKVKKLHFYCYYNEIVYDESNNSFKSKNREKIITLDELTYCHIRKELFYKDSQIDKIRLNILNYSKTDEITFINEIRSDLKKLVDEYPKYDSRLIRIIQIIFSLKFNRVIGYKFPSIITLLNHHFYSNQGFEMIIFKAMNIYGRADEIKNHPKFLSLEKKIKKFKDDKWEQNNEFNEIIYLIFPELYPTSTS